MTQGIKKNDFLKIIPKNCSYSWSFESEKDEKLDDLEEMEYGGPEGP